MYTRQFDVHGQDSLAKLARWVPPGATVLELGPATGYFTRHLQGQGCVIDVVEIDPQAAAEAGRFARTVVVGDVADASSLAPLAQRSYDVIVCADVLEHIIDGRALLARLRPLLASAGCLLLSVPNVAHSALIAGLLDESFEYSREGLLDASHVHLYTRRSLERMLRDAGFRIDAWDAVQLDLYATEFRTRLERYRPEVAEALLARPNAAVYQWLLRATPGDAQRSAPAPALGATETMPLRVLYAQSADALALDRALYLPLPVGVASAVIDVGLPEPAAALRLLLSDRIGVLELDDVELFADGQPVWALAREDPCVSGDGAVRAGATTWALIEAGSYLEPVLDADRMRSVDRIRVTAAWPLARDDAAAFAVFEVLADALTAARRATLRDAERLTAMIDERDGLLAATQRQLYDVEAARAEHERGLIAARVEQDALRSKLAAGQADWARRDALHHDLRWWLRLPWLRRRPRSPEL